MHTASAAGADRPRRHRPSRVTVFATAFVAGAAVAFGVNRMLDVHLAQTRPQVECEPIFVALHALPQGAPITVWDVALKDWPRAMLPASALRARDTFEGMVLRHPLREGQPLLSVQLVPADAAVRSAPAAVEHSFTSPPPATPATQAAVAPEADLWAPVGAPTPDVAAATTPRSDRTDVEAAPADGEPAAAALADTRRVDPPASLDTAEPEPEPVVTADTPDSQPTLAAAPEAPADSLPDLVQPELLVAMEPLYAPVPASPPSDLDGPLAGVGGLPATGVPRQPETGESVLKPGSSDTPADPAPRAAGRYLVVPERIALQADASFAPPPPANPPAAADQPQLLPATTTTATQPVRRPGAAESRRDAPRRTQQQQAEQASGRQARGNQATGRQATTGRQAAAAASRPRTGMFPNLTSGIEALGGTQRKPAAATQPSSMPR